MLTLFDLMVVDCLLTVWFVLMLLICLCLLLGLLTCSFIVTCRCSSIWFGFDFY